MMKVGILALQGNVSEHIYMLKRLGVEAVPVKTPLDIMNINGLIIPGGESTTIGRLMERFDLANSIKNRAAEGMPIYGTCAGMILLSKRIRDHEQPSLALLDVTVLRNAFGRQGDSMETDIDIKGFDSPFHAIFIRAPVAVEPGPEVEVLASVPEGIVFLREKKIIASSFHPELGEDLKVHKYFLDIIGN